MGKGRCEHCRQDFDFNLIHNGFNETAYAYCDSCGCTALLSLRGKMPESLSLRYGPIDSKIEPHLAPCACGGHFRANAEPRCPHCNKTLSAEKATAYIEANAPGAAKGWRWQRDWRGFYAIVIEGRRVKDPWISAGP